MIPNLELRRIVRRAIARQLLKHADKSFSAAQWQFARWPDPQPYGYRVGKLLREYGLLWLDIATTLINKEARTHHGS